MARFTDFLAGCVVGGVLISTGVLLAKRGIAGEEMHVSLTKDDSTAIVWAVDRGTGKARFLSFSAVPPEAVQAMVEDAGRRLGEMLASGGVQNATRDFFGGVAQGAAKVQGRTSPR
jgi:hypothetical protein